jgi:hypothetical protein
MTTDMQSNGTTTLAVREFSDKQIRTRLEAASKPGFGMEKASRDQLNMVYLLATSTRPSISRSSRGDRFSRSTGGCDS